MGQVQVILTPFQEILSRVGNFAVTLLGALLILIVGWIIAKIIQKVVTQLLKIARLDVLSEKAGIASILAKGEIKYTLAELIGIIVYWLLILVVIITALDAFNLTVTSELLNQAVLYVPRVIAAIFILVLGLFFAALLGSVVRTTAANAGIGYAKNLGQITQAVVVIFTVLTTLGQLGVRTVILDQAIVVAIAAAGLALALAFGLGSKDIAGKIMSDVVDKWKRK